MQTKALTARNLEELLCVEKAFQTSKKYKKTEKLKSEVKQDFTTMKFIKPDL